MRTESNQTVLVGVVDYADEAMNFKVPYDWEEIAEDTKAFSLALRDKIAETFDLPLYHVDMQGDSFIEKMREFNMRNAGVIL